MTQQTLLHAVCMYHKAASCYCSLQTQNLMPGQCMKRMSMGSMHSLALVLGLCTHILTNFWTARIYLEGTLATKEVVLRGGPPRLDGVQITQ